MNNLIPARAYSLLFLTAILLLSAFARLHQISAFPVWTDEGWSIWASGDGLAQTLSRLTTDRHPPLYFLLLDLWRDLAGDSRVALRFISLAAGLLTVALTYRLTSEHLGRRVGFYAAALLSVLPISVYYSQEVRHYGLFGLWVLLAWWSFSRMLRRPEAIRWWLLYVLSVAAACYTLYFALLPLAIQGFIGIVLWRQTSRWKLRLILAWVLIGLLYLPWLAVIVRIQWPTLTTGIGGLAGTYPAAWSSLLPLVELLLGPQAVVLLVAAGIGMGLLWASRQRVESMTLFWGGWGLLLLMLVLSLRFNLLSGRTLVFLVPLLVIPCAWGLSRIPRYGRWLLLVWMGVTLGTPVLIQPRLDATPLLSRLRQAIAPDDLVVLEAGWDDNALAYELSRVLPGVEIIRTISRADIYSNEKDLLPELLPRIQAHNRVWVLQWLQAPQILPALDTDGSGYRRVLEDSQPVNESYRQRFGDSTVVAVQFQRVGDPALDLNFGDLFTLYQAHFSPVIPQGTTHLQVDLWWSAQAVPALDYSSGVFLLDASGAVIAEVNAAMTPLPTTTWEPGVWYAGRQTLSLPVGLPVGVYQVAVNAYWYGDAVPLPVDGAAFAVVGTVRVE
jgi:uncharacterized membrane protein